MFTVSYNEVFIVINYPKITFLPNLRPVDHRGQQQGDSITVKSLPSKMRDVFLTPLICAGCLEG